MNFLNNLIQRKKHQSLLHTIGVGWYMNKLGQNLPPLNKRKLIKKSQEKEDKIKRNLHRANQDCNDCKFQIHWKKIEWANPRSCDKQKNPFCVSSIFLKYNIKTEHWVGVLQ